jgi:hypothetical protein
VVGLLASRAWIISRSLLDPPLGPHQHERITFATSVSKVTFNHLPQPLRSHIRSFGTLGQLLKRFTRTNLKKNKKHFWSTFSPNQAILKKKKGGVKNLVVTMFAWHLHISSGKFLHLARTNKKIAKAKFHIISYNLIKYPMIMRTILRTQNIYWWSILPGIKMITKYQIVIIVYQKRI